MSAPFISIIIPTFNRAQLIGQTIESVKQQDLSDFECLIVDDYSTDDTAELIRHITLSDNRFIYLKNQRTKGAPGARNTGLKVAKGEYLTFLDSDDIMLPQALSNRIKAFTSNPKLDLVIANQAQYKNGKATFLFNVPNALPPLVRFYRLYPYIDIPWSTCNTLIKKSFLEENNLIWQEDLERFQDIQFNLSMLLAQAKYKWLNTPVDSYWVFRNEEISIGKNQSNYAKNLIDINNFYLDKLTLVKQHFGLHHQLIIKIIKAFCCYSLFYIQDKQQAKIFGKYLSTLPLFNMLDKQLLLSYHQQNSLFVKKAIRLNFKLKLHQALTKGSFLNTPLTELQNKNSLNFS